MATRRSRAAPARRFSTTTLFLVALWLAPFGGQCAFGDEENVVTITRLDGKLSVEIGGQLFTEYVYKDQPKPILYPVIGPHGIAMTRNYPMKDRVAGEARDHPHHRSLWFTHGDVNGVDFWGEGPSSGRTVHDEIVEVSSGKSTGVIKTRNRWVAPDGKVVCTDDRTLRFAADKHGRLIDYEITLHASHGDLRFGDTKEGTMGIRMHPALRLKNDPGRGVEGARGKALNSEGHRDQKLWGKRAAWVDYWAPIDGKTVGVAIFDHPQNPVHPTWWHARDYGLVAANPFGVHHFEGKRDQPHLGDMNVKAGEKVTFRYRFYFHDGEADIEKAYKAYSSGELRQASRVIQENPESVQAYSRRAAIYSRLRLHEEAIADLSRIVSLDSGASAAHNLRGDEQFKLGKVREALADYDRFLQLRPDRRPYHWKRGIALYYAGEFAAGRRQFERYQTIDADDVENAVWRYLCMAREQDVDKARESMLEIGADPRVPMPEIYRLYRGELEASDVLAAARKGEPSDDEIRKRLFYAHLYIGLYRDLQGETEQSRQHVARAAEDYPIEHFMWDVARVHAKLRARESKG